MQATGRHMMQLVSSLATVGLQESEIPRRRTSLMLDHAYQ